MSNGETIGGDGSYAIREAARETRFGQS